MIIAMRLPVTSSRRCEQITAFGASEVPDVKINAQIESMSGSSPGSARVGVRRERGGERRAERGRLVAGLREPVGRDDRRQPVGDRRQQRLVARLGEHQAAVGVERVAQQVLVAARVVEADDRAADQRGAAEGEEVVGRVVEQHRDVARRVGRKLLEEQRREPARLLEVLGVRPLPVAELDRDAVAELARVAAQQRRRVRATSGACPGAGAERAEGQSCVMA